MTLPFDVDNTGCHMPPFQRSDVSSKHLQYYQDDYLVFNHYTSFTQMLSLLYICHCQVFSTCFCSYHNTLEFYRIISSSPPWKQQITGQWHESMAFGMPLLPHFSLGRRSQPSYLRCSIRMHLYDLLLDRQ